MAGDTGFVAADFGEAGLGLAGFGEAARAEGEPEAMTAITGDCGLASAVCGTGSAAKNWSVSMVRGATPQQGQRLAMKNCGLMCFFSAALSCFFSCSNARDFEVDLLLTNRHEARAARAGVLCIVV